MMKAWLVTVQPGEGRRYVDSVWICEESAGDRSKQLKREFERIGMLKDPKIVSSWWAWVTETNIEDAALGATKKPKEPEK